MKKTMEPINVLRKVSCLVVDDVAENIIALRALLQSDDVDVLSSQSGAEALEILLDNDIALAILDVQMPEMDGFELAELMRGTERTRHIPIFFVTAGARNQQRMFRGYEAGAVDFIYKPIEPDILKNKANVFFQMHRQKLQLAWELRERTEALRLSEMFMAVLGHDLRNPLGAIMASAEVVAMTSSDDNVKLFSDRILSSAVRMTRMIEDLLDLTRARVAGGIPIRPQPMDLQPVLDRVLSEIRVIHPKRAVEISTGGDLNGMWDAERLAQVVSNLVTNALQHGAQGSPVSVDVDGTHAAEVTLCIRNDGNIPEHRRAALFDPFYDASRMAGSRNGLGLGLYIVREIVLAHGGSVDVRADRDGETAFWVHLPRAGAPGKSSKR
ncbi:MAG: hybrid sensor histidine kinase/response regulator [Rudaea sp.]